MTFDESMTVSGSAAILRGTATGLSECSSFASASGWEKRCIEHCIATMRNVAASLQSAVDEDQRRKGLLSDDR